ncbi:MAG: N-acetylmuramoyl-L-alanine amidase [Rickettsiales bacterium]|nr:N-acetylmuramoyl-L-alanine amidase [Rickettsiales bacterium]
MNIIPLASPNHDSREGQPIDMLVLHYTGMQTGAEAIARLRDANAKVSAHYVVEENGDFYALVDETQRAWHAGVSHWRGATNINQRSLGIEIVNPGHEFGYRPFPPAQMTAVSQLCRAILASHDIPARNVVAHSDIAPTRKEDPGELFPWQTLATVGIGLWPHPDATQAPATTDQLADYGYEITNLEKTITAFQRHFRPHGLTGQWDSECALLLAALLRL